jgi:antitoxin component YwqK of YwqJK toxin-antitoxin module
MKKILGILSITFLLSSFCTQSGINEVISAMKEGNATSVSKHFDNTVEISLAGKSNNYSKSQAIAVLRDFFANNNVKSFAIIHQGESGNSQYCIGSLVTNNGTFRTTLNLKQKGDKQMLQEIKFDN